MGPPTMHVKGLYLDIAQTYMKQVIAHLIDATIHVHDADTALFNHDMYYVQTFLASFS